MTTGLDLAGRFSQPSPPSSQGALPRLCPWGDLSAFVAHSPGSGGALGNPHHPRFGFAFGGPLSTLYGGVVLGRV